LSQYPQYVITYKSLSYRSLAACNFTKGNSFEKCGFFKLVGCIFANLRGEGRTGLSAGRQTGQAP
jgi:hypothetical protein